MKIRVVFRTEGNHQAGMGDLWGSLAIGRALEDFGAEVSYLVHDYPEARAFMLPQKANWSALPLGSSLGDELRTIKRKRPDVIVVNKLKSLPEQLAAFKANTRLLVTIDDDGSGAQIADLRFNPLYPMRKALTSFRYVMLRKEFQQLHNRRRRTSVQLERVLVMQGGADTYGFTPKIVHALGQIAEPFNSTIILGPAFRHFSALNQALAYCSRKFEVLQDPPDLPGRMADADLAVSAAGLSIFELACVGTPAIAVCAEQFEVDTARRLEAQGIAKNLGFGGELDPAVLAQTVQKLAASPQHRRQMSRRGRRVVDGRGSERIAQRILQSPLLAGRPNSFSG